MRFRKLFEPIRIRKTLIKNRIAMAPLNLTPPSPLCTAEGKITQRAVDFYTERAKGGVGLINTGVFKVESEIEPLSKDGTHLTVPVFIPKNVSVWAELADHIHSYGSRIFIQLSAGLGRNTLEAMINAGFRPVSASEVPAFYKPSVTTRPLTTEEIRKIVEAFSRAAELLATADIDGIQVHGHEGYLIDQFVTAIWNNRTDKYGGDLEGRLTFPLEIIERIKDTVGKDFPVIYRYGVKHFMKGPRAAARARAEEYEEIGRDVRESLEIAKRLEKAGVDALDVDAGCYDSMYWAQPPMYQPHGYIVDLVAEVKRVVKIPVITAGRLGVPELAEMVLEKGKADIISLGRPLLADPYWPKKVREGRVEDVRPCLGCHDGCMVRRRIKGRPLSCSVNPSCGRERLFALQPALKPLRILIAGGGVAGMEAARVLAIRGREVTVYEKSDELGGHLIEAAVPDFKHDIKRLLNWYKTQLKKLKIKISLGTEVTLDLIKKKKPDVVIIATGSTFIFPEIPGITKKPIVTCCDLLRGKVKTGDNVVVIGGGLEGCETALWLAKQGKSVTVVARHEAIPRGVFKGNRDMLLDLLAMNKVQVLTNTGIAEVTKKGVILIDSNFRRKIINCDTLVLAIGLKPEKELYESLLSEVAELYAIGDCKKPRRIHDAIWDGYAVGYAI